MLKQGDEGELLAQPGVLSAHLGGIPVVLLWPRLGCGLGAEPGTADSKESPEISEQAQPLLLSFPEKLRFFLEASIACRTNVAIAISSWIRVWHFGVLGRVTQRGSICNSEIPS